MKIQKNSKPDCLLGKKRRASLIKFSLENYKFKDISSSNESNENINHPDYPFCKNFTKNNSNISEKSDKANNSDNSILTFGENCTKFTFEIKK